MTVIDGSIYNGLTEVRLLYVPLESDYKDTIYFDSKPDQTAYFQNKTMVTGYEYTYQRKDNVIHYGAHIEDIRVCNYVMYRNRPDSDKWFYAFIKDMKYVNDEVTDIYIETDVIQTWLFDYTLQSSFVEREHVDDDTRGRHTYPEGLETGEYVTIQHETVEALEELIIVVGVTALPDGTRVGGSNYNGLYSGIQYRYCRASIPKLMTDFIASYDDEGRANAIQNLFIVPAYLVEDDSNYSKCGTEVVAMSYSQFAEHEITSTGRTFSFGYDYESGVQYVPRNNKLFSYPFQYLLASNNNGGSAIYRYEDFDNQTGSFIINGVICPGGSIRLIPKQYKNDVANDEEGLNLGKYPICNWQTDVYTNWLTQNSVNLAVNTISNGVSVIAGIASIGMGGAGAIASGLQGIGNTVGQVYAQSLQPPQANGNLNCGDVITASKNNTFHFYQMSIKVEYARIIDEYFDMFGYKICRVKVPNKNHRQRYWYTKTIDVNIDGGGIPMNDMIKIKNCYNSGIRFWRKDSFGYYGTNAIV